MNSSERASLTDCFTALYALSSAHAPPSVRSSSPSSFQSSTSCVGVRKLVCISPSSSHANGAGCGPRPFSRPRAPAALAHVVPLHEPTPRRRPLEHSSAFRSLRLPPTLPALRLGRRRRSPSSPLDQGGRHEVAPPLSASRPRSPCFHFASAWATQTTFDSGTPPSLVAPSLLPLGRVGRRL